MKLKNIPAGNYSKVWFQKDKLYFHKKLGYTAKYIGKKQGRTLSATYEIVNPNNTTFNTGDWFTPCEPHKHFIIVNP